MVPTYGSQVIKLEKFKLYSSIVTVHTTRLIILDYFDLPSPTETVKVTLYYPGIVVSSVNDLHCSKEFGVPAPVQLVTPVISAAM